MYIYIYIYVQADSEIFKLVKMEEDRCGRPSLLYDLEQGLLSRSCPHQEQDADMISRSKENGHPCSKSLGGSDNNRL